MAFGSSTGSSDSSRSCWWYYESIGLVAEALQVVRTPHGVAGLVVRLLAGTRLEQQLIPEDDARFVNAPSSLWITGYTWTLALGWIGIYRDTILTLK